MVDTVMTAITSILLVGLTFGWLIALMLIVIRRKGVDEE